jgi:hypothetical protein
MIRRREGTKPIGSMPSLHKLHALTWVEAELLGPRAPPSVPVTV